MFHSHSDFQLHIIYNQLISSLSLEDATRRKSFYVFGSPKTYKTLLLNICCEAFTLLGRSPKHMTLESNMKFALGYLKHLLIFLSQLTTTRFQQKLEGIFTQEHQLLKGKMSEQ